MIFRWLAKKLREHADAFDGGIVAPASNDPALVHVPPGEGWKPWSTLGETRPKYIELWRRDWGGPRTVYGGDLNLVLTHDDLWWRPVK